MSYTLSLAAGNVQEFDPADMVTAAQATGFDMTGLWVDMEQWTPATSKEVKRRLAGGSVSVLDVEVVWIQPGDPDPAHDAIIDIGGDVGSRFVLIVSSDPDRSATKKRFELLCNRAQQAGLTAVLEFLPITEIKSLEDAVDVVADVGHPASGILVDTLHLVRSGGSAAALKGLDPRLFPYCQIADAPQSLPEETYENFLSEAVDGRLLPGEGALPLTEIMKTLPQDIPVSPEIRSLPLREAYPDIQDRAAAIYSASRAFLDTL